MSFNNDSKFQNIITWSSARFDALQRCERRYFYQYIGSWGGWDPKAFAETQSAYHLKYLNSVDLEVGLLVHDRIEGILRDARAGRRFSVETQVKTSQLAFKVFLALSRTRSLNEVTRTRRKLLVHELGGPISKEEGSFAVQRIEALLRGFFKLGDIEELLKYPEDLLPEFLEADSFEVGNELGVPSRPRTDAVWVTPDSVVIADWKCGRKSLSHVAQALTYDIYVRQKLHLPPSEKVEVRFYYLAADEIVSHQFTEEERQERLWEIGEQFETLRSYSSDRNVNVAHVSRFAAKVTKACGECSFQLMCPEFTKTRAAQPKLLEVA